MTMAEVASGARYRAARLGGSLEAVFEDGPNGVQYVRSAELLGPYPERLTDRLLQWAEVDPDRLLVARRRAPEAPGQPRGDWERLSYGEAVAAARSIAQALLDLGLSAERPVAILSGNDLDHFLLALGAMLAGVPYAPISPAYSTISQDYGKLRHIVGQITPGLVYASDAASYGRAIETVVPADVTVVLGQGELSRRSSRPFAALRATPATADVDAALRAIGPDTIAKFLFTSGSTKQPKGVITTQRMLCANQQQILQCMPFLGDEPPVLVDWLPWNHVFGGSHNVGIAIYNGGSLYIDDGKPVPAAIGETLRNLREVSPTVYFNVPKGFEEIANALEHDPVLCERLFAKVQMFFFAGAGLAQPVWDKLDHVAERHCGERIRMITGLGMTETAPFAICANGSVSRSGVVGLPAPGMELKLVPVDGKLEVRYRGPNVTPGYWRAPEQTREHYDDEGWYCTGDALKPIDPAAPGLGFLFDGRIAEDFKLSTGTFVSVGPLRAKVAAAGDPFLLDAVVAGLNRDDLGLLFFPRLEACREIAGLPVGARASEVLAHPAVRERFAALLQQLYDGGTGSATRPARGMLMTEPPSIDRGEITDKGSINQRAVLTHRAALVEQLYAATADDAAAGIMLARR